MFYITHTIWNFCRNRRAWQLIFRTRGICRQNGFNFIWKIPLVYNIFYVCRRFTNIHMNRIYTKFVLTLLGRFITPKRLHKYRIWLLKHVTNSKLYIYEYIIQQFVETNISTPLFEHIYPMHS